ncbi:MAG TPA: carbohydrate kinase [Solirubrobacteraceae bacterium]|nr:carbohydrate kinase [Solirubrobacteraceae bacterium]
MPAAEGGVILVAGEALVDLVLSGAGELSAHTGGGPFNTARTVGRLEQPVAYLGRISTDRFGARLREELRIDGVALDAVVPTEDPTTLALAEIGDRGAARYRFYVEGTAAPGLTIADALGALPERVATLHVGTLGLVFEPMAEALEAVVERLSGTALVALDLNCRPAAIREPDAYRARLGRMLPRCHLVKASDDDLAWLDPGCPTLQAARALLEHGPRLVLVTRGAEGAVVVAGEHDAEVPAPRVQVVDTIGAGDAFGGAFLAWWRGRGLGTADLGTTDVVLDATRFACLVAARTCERAGASPPRLSELRP